MRLVHIHAFLAYGEIYQEESCVFEHTQTLVNLITAQKFWVVHAFCTFVEGEHNKWHAKTIV